MRRLMRMATVLAAGAIAAGLGAAGASASSGAQLSVFAEPQSGVAPVLRLIQQARKSIDLTMYELDDQQIEDALAAAQKRGVDVRVLLNRKDPFESRNPNAGAYAFLSAHAVQVRYSPSYLSLTHEKTLEVDGEVAAIMSLNLAGYYSSTRDFGVIDRQSGDIAAITQTFNADWANKRISTSTGTGDLVWSPGAASTVMRLIEGAKTTIDVENEEMDYRPATDALCAAAERGVTVRVVMTYDSEWNSAFRQLQACGTSVHVFHGQSYYIHAKLLIADGTALVSSQNLSTESLDFNRELGITLRAPTLVRSLTDWFVSDYAKGSSF